MAKKTIKLTESDIRHLVEQTLKEFINDSDDEFVAHGGKPMNNYGGNEIQISDDGDGARIRYQSGEITDWMEIEFDEEGVAYVTTPDGEQERLCDYMRF